MDYRKIASDIINYVGGQANIQNVTHCFTRLRFVLADESLVQTEKLEASEGVITVVKSGGQTQVVLGAKVPHVFNEINSLLSGLESNQISNNQVVVEKGKQSWGNRIMQIITEMFTPLVPAIAAAGLIKGILTLVNIIMTRQGVNIAETDTYQVLFAASQVIFYFMPIFLAMTAAKALKTNHVIAMMIGAVLVFPAIDAMIQNVDIASTFLGLPIPKQAFTVGEATRVFAYTESVIPIILAVIVLSFLERFLKKIIPEVMQIILVPGLSLLIMVPLTLIVLGPIGIYVGYIIQSVYSSMINFSPLLGGALVGGLWGVLVVFGAHRALLPIGLNDVALLGRQNILAFAGSANFAQGGAALGVMFRTKDKTLKQVAASGAFSATLVGITEPAIYGVNLRLKKPMIIAILCGALGGAIMGFGGVFGDAFANNGVLTIFTYAAFGMTQFVYYLIGIGVAFFGSAILTYLFGMPKEPLVTGENLDAISE